MSLDLAPLDALALDHDLAQDSEAASRRNVTLRVDRSGERALRRGHPWLFADGVTRQSHAGRPGDFGVVFDANRKFVAIGLFDPDSPIRLRVLHAGKPRPIDAAFFAERVEAAVARRAPLLARDTDGYRLVHGENDGLPGLVADRYADALVIRLDTPAWIPHLGAVVAPLARAIDATRVVLRLSRGTAARPDALSGLQDGQRLAGPPLEGPLVFRENGLRFECDPVRGQKTGFFLDQRENRERVERLAAGRDVLNAFAYTGGFSLYAARGGAQRVLSVDQSAPALAAAERNFALNPDLAGVHETLAGDVFEVLPRLADEGRRFGLVIVDPPSFASRERDVERALRAYGRLTALALGVTARGGILVSASCSSRIGAESFFGVVREAARRAGRRFDAIEETGHALDHPVGFAEGHYLKCIFATIG